MSMLEPPFSIPARDMNHVIHSQNQMSPTDGGRTGRHWFILTLEVLNRVEFFSGPMKVKMKFGHFEIVWSGGIYGLFIFESF